MPQQEWDGNFFTNLIRIEDDVELQGEKMRPLGFFG